MISTPRYGGEAAAAVEGATMCWPLGKAEGPEELPAGSCKPMKT